MRTFLTFALGFLLINANHAVASQLAIPINLTNELTQKDNDPFNGIKKNYYPNGKIFREYTLKDGKIEGSYKSYNSLGRLISDQFYKDGLPDGYLRTYFDNGQLQAEINVKGGDISGPSKEYYENGTLKKESNLSGPPFELTGKTILYFENGKVEQEITTSKSKLVYSISYDQEGRVTGEDKPGQSISYWYEEKTGKRHVTINGVPQD